MVLNYVIAILQVLFLVMSATVEVEYCAGPLDPESTTLFVKDTVDFGLAYNPLFHARPEWLVKATCGHAYIMWIFYSTVFYVAITDGWTRSKLLTRVVLPIFLGAKVYAIFFYHYMEFTSETPPTNVVVYFAAEGAYLVSMALVLYKLISAATASDAKDGKQD